MLIPKHTYIEDKAHRRFIASLPCIVCNRTNVQAAHIRSGNKAGMGKKSGDDCTVPLCVTCHRFQHHVGNEKTYWNTFGGIGRANETAKRLYAITGDTAKALQILRDF